LLIKLVKLCNKIANQIAAFMTISGNITGVVKVQGKTYGGGGLKYYLFEKFRAYLLKNIKN